MQTSRPRRISRLAVGGRIRDAGGAIVILALASGGGLGFGAVAEGLTTPDVTTQVSAPTGASLADVFDGWYVEAQGATPHTAGTTIRHVVDRWYDEPAGR
jgi:hypothetical protein